MERKRCTTEHNMAFKEKAGSESCSHKDFRIFWQMVSLFQTSFQLLRPKHKYKHHLKLYFSLFTLNQPPCILNFPGGKSWRRSLHLIGSYTITLFHRWLWQITNNRHFLGDILFIQRLYCFIQIPKFHWWICNDADVVVYVGIDVVVEMFHVLNGCCATWEDTVC